MQKNKNISHTFLIALGIITFFVIFSTGYVQNPLNRAFNKNAKKYTEMYAYMKTKLGVADTYFIVQGNKGAISFFRDEATPVEEDDLVNVCYGSDIAVLVYEKDSRAIRDFVQKKNGTNITLNNGTDIQFYVANIKGLEKSCRVGG